MKEIICSLLRKKLVILGTWLFTKGYADDATWQLVLGGALGLVSILWGMGSAWVKSSLVKFGAPEQSSVPIKTIASILVASTLVLSGSLALTGCATPQRTAYNTVATPAVAVDQAMTLWGDYVRQFQPGPAVEAKVKAAYDKYQAMEVLAIDAAQPYASLASTGTTNVENAQAQSVAVSCSFQKETN